MELSADNIEELARAMASNPESIDGIGSHDFQSKSKTSDFILDPDVVGIQESLLNNSLETIGSYNGSCSFNDIYADICDMSKTFELKAATSNTPNSQFTLPQMTPDCSFSNQAEFLQPLDLDIQWAEYQSNPTSVFNNNQEVAFLPTPPLAPLPPAQTPLAPPAQEITTLNVNFTPQLVSTPVGPVQLFGNCNLNVPTVMVEQPQFIQQFNNAVAVPASQVYYPVENNVNFLMLNEPTVVSVKNKNRQSPHRFDWARVVPRKAVVRPFRTRKIKSSRANFDLASYFDTSSIIIPMIRERPRCINANRRKQKLHTIPRADNLKFEVERQPVERGSNDYIVGEVNCNDINNNEDELYPETDMSELNEIFKRKRRVLTTHRTAQQVKTPTSICSKEEDDVTPLLSLQKPTEEMESNESDLNSDDAPLTSVQSIKCQHCKKIFKTCRSLTIHLKRCGAERPAIISDIPQSRSIRKASMQSSSSKENADIKSTPEQVTRPLTRSQTKAAKRIAAVPEGSCSQKKRLK